MDAHATASAAAFADRPRLPVQGGSDHPAGSRAAAAAAAAAAAWLRSAGTSGGGAGAGYCRTLVPPPFPLHLDLMAAAGAAAGGPAGAAGPVPVNGWSSAGFGGPLSANYGSLLRSPVSPYADMFSPSTPGVYPAAVGPLGAAGAASGCGRLSASPAMDRRFHSPLPGLTHSPLWSPPLAGSSIFGSYHDAAGTLPYYSLSSPSPGATSSSYLSYMSMLAAAAAAAAHGRRSQPVSPSPPFPSPSSVGSYTSRPADLLDVQLPSPSAAAAYHQHRLAELHRGIFCRSMSNDFSPPLAVGPPAPPPSAPPTRNRHRHVSSPSSVRRSNVSTTAGTGTGNSSTATCTDDVIGRQEYGSVYPGPSDDDRLASRRRRKHIVATTSQPDSHHTSGCSDRNHRDASIKLENDEDSRRTQLERESLGLRDKLPEIRHIRSVVERHRMTGNLKPGDEQEKQLADGLLLVDTRQSGGIDPVKVEDQSNVTDATEIPIRISTTLVESSENDKVDEEDVDVCSFSDEQPFAVERNMMEATADSVSDGLPMEFVDPMASPGSGMGDVDMTDQPCRSLARDSDRSICDEKADQHSAAESSPTTTGVAASEISLNSSTTSDATCGSTFGLVTPLQRDPPVFYHVSNTRQPSNQFESNGSKKVHAVTFLPEVGQLPAKTSTSPDRKRISTSARRTPGNVRLTSGRNARNSSETKRRGNSCTPPTMVSGDGNVFSTEVGKNRPSSVGELPTELLRSESAEQLTSRSVSLPVECSVQKTESGVEEERKIAGESGEGSELESVTKERLSSLDSASVRRCHRTVTNKSTGGASTMTSSIPIGIARAQLRHVEKSSSSSADVARTGCGLHGDRNGCPCCRRGVHSSSWQRDDKTDAAAAEAAGAGDVRDAHRRSDHKLRKDDRELMDVKHGFHRPDFVEPPSSLPAEDRHHQQPDLSRLRSMVPPPPAYCAAWGLPPPPPLPATSAIPWYPYLPGPVPAYSPADVVPSHVYGRYFVIPDISWTDMFARGRYDRHSARLSVDVRSPTEDMKSHRPESTSALIDQKSIKCEYLSPPVCCDSSSGSNTSVWSDDGGQRSSRHGKMRTGGKVTVESRGTSPLVDAGGMCQLPAVELAVLPETLSTDNETTSVKELSLSLTPTGVDGKMVESPEVDCTTVVAASESDDRTSTSPFVTAALSSSDESGMKERQEFAVHSVENRYDSLLLCDVLPHRDKDEDAEVDEIMSSKPPQTALEIIREPIIPGYELERITPVEDEEAEASRNIIIISNPAQLYNGLLKSSAPENPIPAATVPNLPTGISDDASGFSGLEILSTVAFQQSTSSPICSPARLSGLPLATLETSPATRRRFCLLDLPLSQFIVEASSASVATDQETAGMSEPVSRSPDVISADYNVPSTRYFSTDLTDKDGEEGLFGVLASVGQPVIRQRAESAELPRTGDVFTSLNVDICPENMDAMELDMRMRLAELQLKYREKQRELARLQRRPSYDRTSHSSRTVRRKVSSVTSPRSATRRRRLSAGTVPATLTSALSPLSAVSSPGGRPRSSLTDFATPTDVPLSPFRFPVEPRTAKQSSSSSAESSSDDEAIVVDRSRNQQTLQSQKPVQVTNGAKKPLISSRSPRKQSPTKKVLHQTSIAPSSLRNVSRKQKQFSFYTHKKNATTLRKPANRKRQTKVGRRTAAKNRKHSKCKTKDLEENSGFYADEWYRRRSERIFLHDATSSTTAAGISTTSTRSTPSHIRALSASDRTPINAATLSTGKARSCSTSGKTPVPKNGGSIVLSPKYEATETLQKLKKSRLPTNSVAASVMPLYPVSTAGRRDDDYDELSSSSDSESEVTTDTDDMPLSAYINRSHITLGNSSILRREDVAEGQRVLFLKDGLFYEGSIKEVMPPDVYGVIIDGERGNRLHIVALEDLLSQAVLIVHPEVRSDVPSGSRICAYWSQKFTGLHPGTVCPDSADSSRDAADQSDLDDDDDDDDLVSVEFDDGDSGRIPLSNIRMLPPNFPVQDMSRFALEMIGGRKRRSVSTDHSRTTDHHNSARQVPQEPKIMWSASQPVAEPMADSSETKPATAALGIVAKVTERRKSDLTLTIRRSDTLSPLLSVSKIEADSDRESSADDSDIDETANNARNLLDNIADVFTSEADSDDNDNDEKNRLPLKTVRSKHATAIDCQDSSSGSSSESDSDEELTLSPRCTVVSGDGRKRKRRGSAMKSGSRKKRRNSTSSGSEIGSFLSVWQQWRWLGKCTQRPGQRGKAKKLFYKAIQRGSETIKIGECAVFVSSVRDLKYIGRIIAMWESWDGEMYVRVKWFYHPQETKGGKRLAEIKGALYQSLHEDENDVQTISHKCEIMSYTDYRRYQAGRQTSKSSSGPHRDVYYLAGTYDPITHEIELEKDVKSAQ